MRLILLLACSFVMPAVGFCETAFKGVVKDSSNAPIAGAMVLIHWDSAGSTVGLTTNIGIKDDLVLHTKQDGTFAVDLPPGFYDVFVAAMAFSPTCRKVRVKPAESVEVELRVNPDPLYMAEMGFRIEAAPPKP